MDRGVGAKSGERLLSYKRTGPVVRDAAKLKPAEPPASAKFWKKGFSPEVPSRIHISPLGPKQLDMTADRISWLVLAHHIWRGFIRAEAGLRHSVT